MEEQEHEIKVKTVIFWLILIFIMYLIGVPLFILGIGIYTVIILLVRSIFRTKNYNHGIYYLIVFIVFLIQGLIFSYMYYFRSVYFKSLSYYILFYLAIGVYMVLIGNFTYYYFHRNEYKKVR